MEIKIYTFYYLIPVPGHVKLLNFMVLQKFKIFRRFVHQPPEDNPSSYSFPEHFLFAEAQHFHCFRSFETYAKSIFGINNAKTTLNNENFEDRLIWLITFLHAWYS